jgi:hypothetical protein
VVYRKQKAGCGCIVGDSETTYVERDEGCHKRGISDRFLTATAKEAVADAEISKEEEIPQTGSGVAGPGAIRSSSSQQPNIQKWSANL